MPISTSTTRAVVFTENALSAFNRNLCLAGEKSQLHKQPDRGRIMSAMAWFQQLSGFQRLSGPIVRDTIG
jgi:hypothetical protein